MNLNATQKLGRTEIELHAQGRRGLVNNDIHAIIEYMRPVAIAVTLPSVGL